MSDPIDEIIRQAMAEGKFKNLPNKGKKLNLDDYFEMPEGLRVGYTLLKNANFIPAEIELLKEITALQETLKNSPPENKTLIQKQIRDKQLQYDLLTERLKKRQG